MQFNKKRLKATAWASKLKTNKFDEFENEQDRLRTEIRNEVRDEVRSRDVYQAMDLLQYGNLRTAGGVSIEFAGSNHLYFIIKVLHSTHEITAS